MDEGNELEQNQNPSAGDGDESQEDTNEDASNQSESNESKDDNSQEDESNDDENGDDNESESDEDEDDAMVPLSKLKKVRNEAKNLRDRLKIAEAKVAELEGTPADEALTKERDDLKGKVDSLTRELTTERLSVHLNQAATDNGAIEPTVVSRLVDVDTVQWGEDGQPTNIADIIAELKGGYPKLFAATQGSGNVGNRSEPRGRDEVMSPNSRLANAYKK